MNQTLQDIYGRKSVRAYEEKEIGEEEKRRILEAAIQAPTAGNMTLFTIIDVTDQALKERLVETCDHQPFIGQAPLVLLFCADYQRWYDAFCAHETDVRKPAEGDLMLAMEDTMIAAQNAVVAAQSMGIGSCYVGDFLERYEMHREILKLPKYVLPAVLIAFGYPTKQQRERQKPPRFQVEDVVGVNGYPAKTGREFMEILEQRQGKEGEEFDLWFTAFFKRKWNCAFSEEMSRSVKEMIAEWNR